MASVENTWCLEATHDYTNLKSDFIIAQYDKGIEGILSDLQAVSGNSAPLDELAGKVVEVAEVSPIPYQHQCRSRPQGIS